MPYDVPSAFLAIVAVVIVLALLGHYRNAQRGADAIQPDRRDDRTTN